MTYLFYRQVKQLDELKSHPALETASVEAAGGKPRILVVEDNPEMNRFIAETLKGDYGIAVAAEGRAGFEKARQWNPDLVLTDVMMPGWSGADLLREMRRDPALRDIPVVLLTAKADEELRIKLLREGAQDYITKPFSADELRLRLGNIMATRRARQTLQSELTSQSQDLMILAQETIQRKRELEQALRARRDAEEALRRLNEELEQRISERTAELQMANRELESFSYSVSHDLRAPLRAVQGMATALVEDYCGALDPIGQDYAHRIIAAAKRMDELIQDLLAYSRIIRGQLQLHPVDLDSVVAEAQNQLNTEIKERQVDLQIKPMATAVLANRTLLRQTLTNLLSNAIKFVAQGVRPQVRIWSEEKGKYVRICVRDNGIGIAPEHQERIFKVFERLHTPEAYPGTGIGLAIVQKAVRRMGGQLGLQSAPGEGTLFWIEFKSC